MKRFLHILYCGLLLSLLCVGGAVEAHTLQNVQGRTVILHVDPDDDPVIGKPATISFEIDDPAHSFDSSECDCQITISTPTSSASPKGVRVLLDEELENAQSPHSIFALQTSFVFSEKNIYTITLIAVPKAGASFEKFQVTFPLRVERVDESLPPLSMKHGTFSLHFFHIVIFGGFFLGMIIWLSIGQYSDIQARKMRQEIREEGK